VDCSPSLRPSLRPSLCPSLPPSVPRRSKAFQIQSVCPRLLRQPASQDARKIPPTAFPPSLLPSLPPSLPTKATLEFLGAVELSPNDSILDCRGRGSPAESDLRWPPFWLLGKGAGEVAEGGREGGRDVKLNHVSVTDLTKASSVMDVPCAVRSIHWSARRFAGLLLVKMASTLMPISTLPCLPITLHPPYKPSFQLSFPLLSPCRTCPVHFHCGPAKSRSWYPRAWAGLGLDGWEG